MANISEITPVIILSLCLAYGSHCFSKYDDTLERYQYKDKVFYLAMAMALIVFAGLRTRYNDTGTYIVAFERMPNTGSVYSGVKDWRIGSNPGFYLTVSILRHLNVSTQDYLMLFSLVTNGIYLWFLRKYSSDIWLTLFLFIMTGCYMFTFAAVKQCTAMALCLIAVDCALRSKWKKYVFWVLLATTFHPYALLYFCVPFMMHRPWHTKTYISIFFFAMAGMVLQVLLGTIVSITSMLGETYDVSSFNGEGVNPFRLAVCAVPAAISFLARKNIAQAKYADSKAEYLFVNLAILNAEIMFVALFGTANYFARLANYMLTFQALSIPWLLRFFETRSRAFLVGMAVFCYCVYFYYENAINQHFNDFFDAMPLWEYVGGLF